MRRILFIAGVLLSLAGSAQTYTETFDKSLDSLGKRGWTFTNTFSVTGEKLVTGGGNTKTYSFTTEKIKISASGTLTFETVYSRTTSSLATLKIELLDETGTTSLYTIDERTVTPSMTPGMISVFNTYTGVFRIRVTYSTGSSNAALTIDNLSMTGAGALPVTWLKVWTTPSKNWTTINWSVIENSHTDRYEVQVSTDGLTWKTIGTLKAAGLSYPINYSFNHNF